MKNQRQDKRIKYLENANKIKYIGKNEYNILPCEDCEFQTIWKRGLRVHIKEKHTNLKTRVSPNHCEFCDNILESEKEMKVHLKNHVCKEAVFKCEDCDFFSKN